MPRGGKRAGAGRKPSQPAPLPALFDSVEEIEALPIDADGLRRRAALALAMSGADDRVIAAAICSDLATVADDIGRGRLLLAVSVRARIFASATGRAPWTIAAARWALRELDRQDGTAPSRQRRRPR
jgi:hypothetical protein